MSMAELVGSVLMFGIRGGRMGDPDTRADVDRLRAIHARGVILFDHDIAGNHPRNIDNPRQLKRFIADLRHELGEGLIVAIDQEGGGVSRLKAERGFKPSMTASQVAACEEIDRVQHAQQQARQLADMGIDLNFAPCVDLAIEPDSPIIAGRGRSYGADPAQVIANAREVIDAHAEHGVRCCLKHFPGHGSALLDSHKGMCDITATHQPDEVEVYRSLLETRGDSVAVMVGHLMHRGIDERHPASLSRAYVTGMLREQMGFGGVVVTDSMDMRAIRDHYGEGEAAALALAAGCDLILDGLNAPGYREPDAPIRVADAIAGAIGRGLIPDAERRLEESRARIDRFMGRRPM